MATKKTGRTFWDFASENKAEIFTILGMLIFFGFVIALILLRSENN